MWPSTTFDTIADGYVLFHSLSLVFDSDAVTTPSGILGIATGVVSAGAGIAFSVICTAVSASRQPQNVLAREGDEIWQAEMVGKENNALKHVMYYWLVDPYRQQAQRTVPAAWIIHEDRKDLVA